MKKFTVSILILATLFSITSCGTIAGAITKGKRPVYLIDAPKDLTVKVNGQEQDISSELFASHSDIGASRTVDFYTAAVNLPYKKKMNMQLSTSGGAGSVDLKPKSQSAIFWANLIFAPIVGHIIDAVTKNNKTLGPRYIDVPAVLAGKPKSDWRSKSQLKKYAKKKGRQNMTKA